MNVITESLFSNSAHKYLAGVLEEEEEKDPKQVREEEKIKEKQEKEKEERKALIVSENSKREEKRQAMRDKYGITKREPEEENSAIEDGIEVVQEHIETIKKKNSCKCM